MRHPVFILAFVAASPAACAGRDAQPVAVVQPQDGVMDCDAIRAESESNTKKMADLSSKKGAKVAQNVAAGLAGVVVPIFWFGMDFKGAASTEQAALESRQSYLAALA
jgi:hypothetical protein